MRRPSPSDASGLAALVGDGGDAGLVLLIGGGGEASANGQIEVTITNLTRAQPLSPPVVASHSANGPQLFVAGQPLSPKYRSNHSE